MGGRSLLSVVVLCCATAAVVVVTGVAGLGAWLVGRVEASVLSNSGSLGGVGQLLLLVAAAAVVAAAVVAWIPFAAAISYVVGRELRGTGTTVTATARGVYRRRRPVVSWLKTLLAVGDLETYLDEGDVRRSEVAAGCDVFVLPALMVDTATLREAVGRANRVVPPGGRWRVWAVGGAGTVLVAVGVGVGTVPAAAGIAVVVGGTITAVADVVWRTRTYLDAETAY
ncbi:MAG: hypothetical protein PPP58_11045 [Natronomonas sp.]